MHTTRQTSVNSLRNTRPRPCIAQNRSTARHGTHARSRESVWYGRWSGFSDRLSTDRGQRKVGAPSLPNARIAPTDTDGPRDGHITSKHCCYWIKSETVSLLLGRTLARERI